VHAQTQSACRILALRLTPRPHGTFRSIEGAPGRVIENDAQSSQDLRAQRVASAQPRSIGRVTTPLPDRHQKNFLEENRLVA